VNHRMDRGLYERVLDDLGSIGYAGVVRFARYSEPMADDHIYELVAAARKRLPRATIDIVSNGDYLKPDSLSRLREAGLSVLRISVYVREGVRWSPEEARYEIGRLGRRLGIAPQLQPSMATSVYGAFPFPGLPIEVYSHDFDRTGYDRGQLLPQLVDRGYSRQSPCSLVFTNFTIDWDGKVMPCCNLRSDDPQHVPYVLGDLSASGVSIFDVYADEAATGWRRSLASVGVKDDPCRTCKQKTVEGEALIRLQKRIHRRLDGIGVAL
jgi:radical SAM protein with 4Fe4S-binding SPASM domain